MVVVLDELLVIPSSGNHRLPAGIARWPQPDIPATSVASRSYRTKWITIRQVRARISRIMEDQVRSAPPTTDPAAAGPQEPARAVGLTLDQLRHHSRCVQQEANAALGAARIRAVERRTAQKQILTRRPELSQALRPNPHTQSGGRARMRCSASTGSPGSDGARNSQRLRWAIKSRRHRGKRGGLPVTLNYRQNGAGGREPAALSRSSRSAMCAPGYFHEAARDDGPGIAARRRPQPEDDRSSPPSGKRWSGGWRSRC